jgi:hypothetical protein
MIVSAKQKSTTPAAPPLGITGKPKLTAGTLQELDTTPFKRFEQLSPDLRVPSHSVQTNHERWRASGPAANVYSIVKRCVKRRLGSSGGVVENLNHAPLPATPRSRVPPRWCVTVENVQGVSGYVAVRRETRRRYFDQETNSAVIKRVRTSWAPGVVLPTLGDPSISDSSQRRRDRIAEHGSRIEQTRRHRRIVRRCVWGKKHARSRPTHLV